MLEAQQVGDMCFKYKKNLYNIAYVAGGLTSKRRKEQRLLGDNSPRKGKKKFLTNPYQERYPKTKNSRKKTVLEWYSAEQFLSFLDLASALRPGKSIHIATLCILQDLLIRFTNKLQLDIMKYNIIINNHMSLGCITTVEKVIQQTFCFT